MADSAGSVAREWSRRSAAYERFYAGFGEDRRAGWLAAAQQWLGHAPLRVLDVGTGTGFLAAVLAELGHEVVGVDLAAGMLPRAAAEARRRGVAVTWHHQRADEVAELGPFDVVTARFVLWTLPQPAAALGAWHAALRPGGTVLVADGVWRPRRWRGARAAARCGRDRVRLGRHLPHWRGLDPGTATDLLTAAGFARPDRVENDLPGEAWPVADPFFVLRAGRPHART